MKESIAIRIMEGKRISGHGESLLHWAWGEYGDDAVFASSLGMEDQVILDMMWRAKLNFPVFTLDTGRLFPETLQLLAETEERYGIRFRVMFPDAKEVEEMVSDHGINLFYKSIENRKLCCKVRKIHPLRRALAGHSAWICGLRREQSETRAESSAVSWDEGNHMVKICPLIDWDEGQVHAYVKKHDVPVNSLHEKEYPSIGCACCTRAVAAGEDPRSGRWWWEAEEKKECGLHWVDGRLARAVGE